LYTINKKGLSHNLKAQTERDYLIVYKYRKKALFHTSQGQKERDYLISRPEGLAELLI